MSELGNRVREGDWSALRELEARVAAQQAVIDRQEKALRSIVDDFPDTSLDRARDVARAALSAASTGKDTTDG